MGVRVDAGRGARARGARACGDDENRVTTADICWYLEIPMNIPCNKK